MDTPKYLYHYTSLETLALILENRTIAFNSLLNVDDVEEAETADLANFGKYVYVSCWTDVESESIAMWNLYTPNMQGVRIKLPVFPFRKFHYQAGQHHAKEAFDTFINFDRLTQENKCMITSNMPELYPVTYTRDKKLLMPKVRSGTKEDAMRFLSFKSFSDVENVNTGYSFAQLGKFKREDWRFQSEWRYWLFMSPMGMQAAKGTTPEEQFKNQQELIRRLEDVDYPVPYQRFLMDLDEDCIKQMEVVLGPKMTSADRILAYALLEKHGLKENCKDSVLRIR